MRTRYWHRYQSVNLYNAWKASRVWSSVHCYIFSPIVKRILVSHYIDVITTTMASQITSLTVVYSNVYSDTDQRKHQSSASLAFVWGIHRDRWIPRTKDQLRGKCFHLMTLSCELVGYGHMFFLNYASIITVTRGVYNYSYLPPPEVPSILQYKILNPQALTFPISSCSYLCPIHWSYMLSWEWRCSWSSADRRCSNYIWVISNFIAY